EAVDQALKLQVRQTVLPFLLEIGAAAVGSPDALAAFEKAAEPIRRLAENAVRAAGFDYPVSVEIGPHRFPDRSGGDWSLPAGEYNSVVITIGEGAGANWWCVLFPPMCIDGAVEDRGTPESAGIPWETAPSVEAQAPAGREATSGGADRDVKEHGDRISVEWSVGWLQALGENGYGRLLLSWWQATVQAAEANDL